VALTVIVTVGAALILSLMQTNVYEASARVLLKARQSSSSGTSQLGQADASGIATEIEVMRSQPVLATAHDKLGVAVKPSITQVGTTSVVQVSARAGTGTRAAALTNGYVDAYIDYRLKQSVDQLQSNAKELQSRIDELQKRIDELGAQFASLPACGTTSSPECDRRGSLQRDRDSLVSQQVPLKQQLDQLQIGLGLRNAGAELVTPAVASATPISPRPVRNVALALGLGLLVGIALALMFEYFDESIKGKDELERSTPSLPVLGMIPTTPGWRDRADSYLVSIEDPNSPSSEAYRSLRTSIRFLDVDSPLRTIQITSPNASEGKTTTIANLAVVLAKAGERVVVVSCDLRRPRLHEFFGLSNAVGFTSVLLGESPLSSALQRVNDTDPLWLLASGPLPPNPSELLSSKRAAETLSGLAGFADVVLIDCPPVLPVTDSSIISSRVDGTLLVATAGTTTRKQVVRSIELLRQVGAPLVGSVLNNAPSEGGYSYVYRRYEPPVSGSSTSNGSTVLRRSGETEAAPGPKAAVRPPV